MAKLIQLYDEDVTEPRYELISRYGILSREQADYLSKTIDKGEKVIYLNHKNCFAVVKIKDSKK